MSRIVLVVAAHADDEVLGCGGTIAKHVAAGDKVHVVFMADGVGSRGGEFESAVSVRETAMNAAAKILGTSSTICLGFPDNKMDTLALLDIVQPLEKVLQSVQPEVVYTHHHGDLNIDHRLTFQAVMTACRPVPGSSVTDILTFEVLSSTEWQPPGQSLFIANLYVDIGVYLEIKEKAIGAYAFEMLPAPHSRSVENLAFSDKYSGHCVGLEAAERFAVVRMLR